MVAIAFPTDAVDEQQYVFEGTTYVYDALNNRWIAEAAGGGSIVVQQARPDPTAGSTGDLWWYCGNDTNDPGLFTLVSAPVAGTTTPLINHWMQSSPGIVGGSGAADVGTNITLESEDLINGLMNRETVSTSLLGFENDGGTLTIPADFWLWSDDVTIPALLIDTPNVTVINNGIIIGRGGDGSGNGGHGVDGGAAISIVREDATIINNVGAWIAGGGGGGATNTWDVGDAQSNGGGGGAGGGRGGRGSDGVTGTNPTGIGGIINAVGTAGVQAGAQAGANGGAFEGHGGGGGRILPGTASTNGGAGGQAGTNGGVANGPGGGGWGAAGGNGAQRNGGAGGAAIDAEALYNYTADGNVFGSLSPFIIT